MFFSLLGSFLLDSPVLFIVLRLSVNRRFVLVLSTMALGVFNDNGHQEGTLSVVPGSATNHGRAGVLKRDFRISLSATKLGLRQKAGASKDDAKQVSLHTVNPLYRYAEKGHYQVDFMHTRLAFNF